MPGRPLSRCWENYGGQLILPEGALVGRDLEVALNGEEPAFLSGGESFEALEGVTVEVLPRWEGLRLTVHGVEVVVEWEQARSRIASCSSPTKGRAG